MKPKPPEVVNVGGRPGLKVYLCQPCAAKLRELARKAGGILETIDVSVLCAECRKATGR